MIDKHQKAISDHIDEQLAKPPLNVADAKPAAKLRALSYLVGSLESALKIVRDRYLVDPPASEPFPGAAATVLRQALAAVELARKSGLLL
jgi:hypothetical protein